jgi:bla regulator protein blaR1
MSAVPWFIPLLIDAAWKGSLLVALAMCVIAAGRDRIPAKWRHALLLIALLRFALPFTPSSPFSIFNLAQPRTPPLMIEQGSAIGNVEPLRAQTLTIHSASRTPSIVFGIWAAGAFFFLIRELVCIARLRRRLRRHVATPIVTQSVLDALDSCRDVLRVRRVITLASSDAVSTPSLLGIVRPTLLLPRDGETSLSAEQLRFIFLHEVAHLRRLDVVVNWLTAALRIVHWFNPLIWIAVSHLAEERELACDALALEHLTRRERSGYAATVIELLERTPALGPAPALVGMATTKHQLKRRILMIANFRSHSRRAAWPGALVLAFALISLTDAGAGEQQQFMRVRHPLSPEAAAVMEKLEQKVSLTLTDKPVSELLATVQSATGVTINVAKDALDTQTRINVNADRVPAHMVLLESLCAVGLSLDFNADGVTVVKRAEGEHSLFNEPVAASGDAGKQDVVFIRHMSHDGAPTPEMHGVAATCETSPDGVMRRKVTLRDGQEGPDGTLEIEVRHNKT